LPTGAGPEPIIHLARTVTRRLERGLVAIEDEEGSKAVRQVAKVYVNRLSDWFFVFARWVTKNMGEQETLWTPLGKRGESSNVANMIRKIGSNDADYNDLD